MKPGLVAIDLDGTLIGESLQIGAEDRAAIRKAVDLGSAVCLATGRLYAASLPFAKALDLHGQIIVLQGSAIYDIDSGRLLHCTPLDRTTALKAYDTLKSLRFHLQLYFGDEVYLDEIDDRARYYLKMSRVTPIVVDDLRNLLSGSGPSAPGPLKVLGIDNDANVNSAIPTVTRELGSEASVFKSLPIYLEVTNPVANKGNALAWVAQSLHIALHDTAAIGDSDNDVPMLELAGRSFVVANGTPAAKCAADRVVAPFQRQGVAEAIRMLLDE